MGIETISAYAVAIFIILVLINLMLKSAKRKVTVSYDKLESVKCYQIFYCEKGTKNWHKVNVVATSVILNNLKSGKTYQIKVRGKARLNKKNVYSVGGTHAC